MLRLMFATLAMAGVASAGTLDCSTADSYVHYSFNATDGGAPRPDIIRLNVGGTEAPKGTKLAFVQNTMRPLAQKKIPNFVITTYTQQIQVTPPGSERPSIVEYAICRSKKYVGPPIPSAPGPGGR